MVLFLYNILLLVGSTSAIDVPLRPFAHFSLISSSLCDGIAQPVASPFVVGSRLAPKVGIPRGTSLTKSKKLRAKTLAAKKGDNSTALAALRFEGPIWAAI